MCRISFQCPDTGQTVIALYAFGRVTVRPAEEQGDGEVDPQTIAYCRRVTNKRCQSLDEADEYIRSASDGQAFCFDRY